MKKSRGQLFLLLVPPCLEFKNPEKSPSLITNQSWTPHTRLPLCKQHAHLELDRAIMHQTSYSVYARYGDLHHPLSTSCFCVLSYHVRISVVWRHPYTLQQCRHLSPLAKTGNRRRHQQLWCWIHSHPLAPGMRDAKRCQAEPLVDWKPNSQNVVNVKAGCEGLVASC